MAAFERKGIWLAINIISQNTRLTHTHMQEVYTGTQFWSTRLTFASIGKFNMEFNTQGTCRW